MKEKKTNSLIVKTYTFFHSFLVVAGWTGVSRLSGVVREIIFANIFGASAFSDIYAFSIKLPNFFRRFFAEGALSAVLVPKFSEILIHQTKEEVQLFARRMFSILATGLFFFVLIFEFGMPWVVRIIAPGFHNHIEVYTNVVYFARWMFPYIWLISLVALMSGFLNSMHHFAWPAAISIIVNLALISSLVIGKTLGTRVTLREIMHFLCFAMLIGGVVQCIILWKTCQKQGLFLRLTAPQLTPEIRNILKASIPGMIGASVMQINVFVDMAFASLLPIGSVSYLNYADRINQLPLSLFGVALGTALLPKLSRCWQNHEKEEAYHTQNKSILFGLTLIVPAAIGLFVLAEPIITLVFGHGKFGAIAILQTMLALKAFVIGLPAYLLSKVFSTVFFANRDTRTPVITATICIFVNGILNYVLKDYFAHVGIAMATAIASWINAGLGFCILRHRKLLSLQRENKICIAKILILSLIMGLIVFWIANSFVFPNTFLAAFLPIIGGALVYAGLCFLLNVKRDVSNA